jgi:hypothetical protein
VTKITRVSTTTVPPARYVRGRLKVPGDKAISHRYAIFSALAGGPSRLSNYAPGADCHSTLACLRALGVSVIEDGTTVTVMGRGLGRLGAPSAPLDAGNSGTTMRMMSGVLAAQPFTTTLIGDEPASPAHAPRHRSARDDGLPHRVDRRPSAADDPRDDVDANHASLPATPSAQVKSAILFAGLHTHGTTTVVEPAQTRDHTEQAIRAFGGTVRIEDGGRRVSIEGPQSPPASNSRSRRFSLRRVLDGCRGGAARFAGGTRRCRAEPEPHGVARCPAAGWRTRDRRSDGRICRRTRGTVIVEGDRIGRVDIAPEEVPDSSMNCRPSRRSPATAPK